MDVKNSRDLAKIIALCRKKGVRSCKIAADSIEFVLSEQAPTRSKRNAKDAENGDAITPYSPEDVLFWSSAGIPIPGVGEN